ncbi:DUF4097 family beta strand repeat-containing protein [Gramella jeungdoensis]|uniref:DUF4097 family beta strand repeat-containing protein n=1 Tax=Gramella jeungdoensis TaxID=708091 RepID=A0ABT0YWZ6_9FLAO|nr:DUF4097 family beta strand repeat-containing protein [Gramella jeungdoensis]MCM8567981.1 DUF4097 family beta strand repeat-containing protein [Gramella jeungdoensis]
MKNLFSFLFLLMSFSIYAQKEITKEVKYENQSVKVEFPFASDIQIKTWDKSTIRVEAKIETEEEKYTEMFALQINSDDSSINIESNSKDMFEAYHEEKKGSAKKIHGMLDHEFNYVLYIPKNVKLKLNSITAKVFSDFLQGDIEVEVVSGDIVIKEHKGNLQLNSVAGKINVACKNASLNAKTLTGEIHTSEKLKLERKNNFIGHEVTLQPANAENTLNLTTVSGDIYLN